MSYQSEVLVDNPVVFLRLDELGAGVNGATIPDLSGNGFEGTHLFTATEGEQCWGFTSPIETDAASREFRGWTNAGIDGLTGTSSISVPYDSAMDASNDFACEAWIRPLGDVAFSGTFALVNKQGTGGIALASISGTRITGYCIDSVGTVWRVPATFLATDHLGESFHVVVVRQVNTLSLYINGFLDNQITITSGLGNQVTSDPFHVHGEPTFYLDARYDEAQWYTDHLTSTRVLAHYEAGRARQPMYATIVARSSFLADLTPPPSYRLYPLRHNFATPVVERIARLTDVQQIKDGREARAGLTTKTRRRIAYESWVKDSRMRRKMAGFLWSNMQQPAELPILVDAVPLTNAITASATSFNCDTRYRDFDPGSQFKISTSETEFEIGTIDSITTTSITPVDPIENDWPIYAKVEPLKLAQLEQDLSISGHTSEVEQVSVIGSIMLEDIPSSPNRITTHVPDYTYRSVEVFNPFEWGDNDYGDGLEYKAIQQGEMLDNQTGIFLLDATDAPHAQQGLAAALWLKGRDVISSFLGWFENRAGRLNPLWVPTMQKDFNLVSMAGSTITVSESDYEDDYNVDDHRRDICLIQLDGTLIFRRVNSVAPSGSNEVLTVDSSVAAYASTTRKICFLRKCRLEADELELVWHTTDLVRVVFQFRELLRES